MQEMHRKIGQSCTVHGMLAEVVRMELAEASETVSSDSQTQQLQLIIFGMIV